MIKQWHSNNTYGVSLLGEVRLDQCDYLDSLLDKLYQKSQSFSIVIDVTQAQLLDSTSLGLLARLAIAIRDNRPSSSRPLLLGPTSDIQHTFNTMGISNLFTSVGIDKADSVLEDLEIDQVIEDGTKCTCEEKEVQGHILSAHQTLAALNEANNEKFSPLIKQITYADKLRHK